MFYCHCVLFYKNRKLAGTSRLEVSKTCMLAELKEGRIRKNNKQETVLKIEKLERKLAPERERTIN